jgi:hypothetical protein
LKLAKITAGGQTDGGVVAVGVTLPVGVEVGVEVGVILPVDVGVGVEVNVEVAVIVPVDVGVKVGVMVPVEVAVDVEVDVMVGATFRLRKTTIVCEAAVPSTIVTVALLAVRFLLIRRLAGIV